MNVDVEYVVKINQSAIIQIDKIYEYMFIDLTYDFWSNTFYCEIVINTNILQVFPGPSGFIHHWRTGDYLVGLLAVHGK